MVQPFQDRLRRVVLAGRGTGESIGTHHILHVGSWWVHAGPDVVVIIQQGTHVPGRDVALPPIVGHPQATQGVHCCALGPSQL